MPDTNKVKKKLTKITTYYIKIFIILILINSISLLSYTQVTYVTGVIPDYFRLNIELISSRKWLLNCQKYVEFRFYILRQLYIRDSQKYQIDFQDSSNKTSCHKTNISWISQQNVTINTDLKDQNCRFNRNFLLAFVVKRYRRKFSLTLTHLKMIADAVVRIDATENIAIVTVMSDAIFARFNVLRDFPRNGHLTRSQYHRCPRPLKSKCTNVSDYNLLSSR